MPKYNINKHSITCRHFHHFHTWSGTIEFGTEFLIPCVMLDSHPASYGLQGESSSAWKPSDLVILAGDLLNAQKVDAAWCSYSSWIYDWHQVVSIWWYPMISTTDQDVNRVVDLNMADGNLIPKKHSKNKQCCCCCCCVAHPRMTVKLTKFQDGSGVLCMFGVPEGSQDVPGTIRSRPWWFEQPFWPLIFLAYSMHYPCILSPHIKSSCFLKET